MYLFYRKHFLPKFQSTAHNFGLRKNVERKGQTLGWERGETRRKHPVSYLFRLGKVTQRVVH